MTPEERIEAVARAIVEEALGVVLSEDDHSNVVIDGYFDARDLARSAILVTLQSLLEPSDGMAVRAVYTADFDRITTAEFIWRLMIQQAIKEHSE